MRLPGPGEAAVSPARERLVERQPQLAPRYPDRFLLETDGLTSGGELFAYVRPLADHAIRESQVTLRIAAFGPAASGTGFMPLGLESPPDRLFILIGLVGFLVVPGLVVLTLGVAAASSIRDRRFTVLRWIGAPRGAVAALTAVETALLAAPGTLVALLAWALVAPQIDIVPLVGYDTMRGDLAVPISLLVGGWLMSTLVAMVVSVLMVSRHRRRGSSPPRPSAGLSAIAPLRFAPLAVAGGAMVVWTMVPDKRLAAALFYASVALALGSIPLLLPSLLRPVGDALAKLGSPAALLAGRQLSWNPVRTARPFAGLGVLMVLALTTIGYQAFLAGGITAPTPSLSGASAVNVRWIDPHQDDLGALRTAIGGDVQVIPAADGGRALEVGATCAQLAPFLRSYICGPTASMQMSDEATGELTRLVGAFGAPIRLVEASSIPAPGQAIVLGMLPASELQERVQTAATRSVTAPFVYSPQNEGTKVSPLVAWICGGLAIGLVLLAVGCVIAIVDRLLATRGSRRHLLALGLVPRQLAVLEAWQFAAPFTVVVLTGAVVGLAISLQIVLRAHEAVPWMSLAGAVGTAIVIGVVGTVMVSWLSVRSMLEDRV